MTSSHVITYVRRCDHLQRDAVQELCRAEWRRNVHVDCRSTTRKDVMLVQCSGCFWRMHVQQPDQFYEFYGWWWNFSEFSLSKFIWEFWHCTDVQVIGCVSNTIGGGFVFTYSTADVIISNFEFINNTCSMAGGEIFLRIFFIILDHWWRHRWTGDRRFGWYDVSVQRYFSGKFRELQWRSCTDQQRSGSKNTSNIWREISGKFRHRRRCYK